MNIQGVCILSQSTFFSPMWYGVVAWIIMIFLAWWFGLMWLDGCEEWAGPICWVCFVLFIICAALTFTENSKTIFNHPSKIKYTVEITDDNAWKELGPNYTVKEKLYETKEIYIIEGDYVDDNT